MSRSLEQIHDHSPQLEIQIISIMTKTMWLKHDQLGHLRNQKQKIQTNLQITAINEQQKATASYGKAYIYRSVFTFTKCLVSTPRAVCLTISHIRSQKNETIVTIKHNAVWKRCIITNRGAISWNG